MLRRVEGLGVQEGLGFRVFRLEGFQVQTAGEGILACLKGLVVSCSSSLSRPNTHVEARILR